MSSIYIIALKYIKSQRYHTIFFKILKFICLRHKFINKFQKFIHIYVSIFHIFTYYNFITTIDASDL